MKLIEHKCRREYVCNDFLKDMNKEQAEVALLLLSTKVDYVNNKPELQKPGKWRDVLVQVKTEPKIEQYIAENNLKKILCEIRMRILGKIGSYDGGYYIEIPDQ